MSVLELAHHLAPTSGWEDTRECDHFVQFYEDEAVLLESVNGFIMSGLATGAAVVVATRPHLDGLERQWTGQGLDMSAARERGQYVRLDATEALSKLLFEGWPKYGASPT